MNSNENPFKFLESHDVAEVAQILSIELPFVSGAALSRMPPVFTAKVMASMPDEIRGDIASAISKYRQVPVEVMYDIAEELEKKLNTPGAGNFSAKKNSLLANLDLGAISNAISNLKTDKSPSTQERRKRSTPEPVESRIIQPEEFEEYQKKQAQPSIQGHDPLPSHTENSTTPTSLGHDGREPSPEVKRELALQRALKQRASKSRTAMQQNHKSPMPHQTSYKAQKVDGMALAAHILRESDSNLKNLIMAEIPELYAKLTKKMFDFADLERSDKNTLGRVFSGLDPKICALALRFASDTIKNNALTSVSKRKATLIIDELKLSSHDRVRITDIENAQQEAIDYAIELQNRGEIIIDPDDSSIV